jgi:hypothetical protein
MDVPMHFWEVARVEKKESAVSKRREDFGNIVLGSKERV